MLALRERRSTRFGGRRHDERGATFILTAVCMVLLFWAGAFGVDLGFTVDGGRQAQSMADTAALDMARYVNIADVQSGGAAAWLTSNKLPYVDTDNASNATLTVAPGEWSNGKWSTPTGCAAGSPPLPACNAVKVTATQSVPQIFSGGRPSVTRTAIAAVTPEESFSIGSYLASFDSQQAAALNALFSTLGSPNSATVTLVGYAGLANTEVTVNQLIAASNGWLTPTNVMTASLTGSQWLTVWGNAIGAQVSQLNCSSTPTPFPCEASDALSDLGFGGQSAQLCQLVSINGSSCANGTLATSALNADLNVLQILETQAEVANLNSALDLTAALSLPLATSSTITFQAVQPAQIAYGPVGTTASTAQIQADFQMNILGTGLFDIPLTTASATATLTNLTCSGVNALFRTQISVAGTTSTANVTLAGAGIGTLSISGYSAPLSFAANAVPPTATTAQQNTNPKVGGTTSPTLTYSGLDGSALTTPLTGVFGPVLQALGVSVGGSQTTVLSANCGAVSLVQ
jgi:uncharacterized membrane protein